MKPLKTLVVAAIVSFITAGGAVAQDMRAKATIPFNFIVGEKTMPAGTYEIHAPIVGVIQLQNPERTQSVMTVASHGILPENNTGKLVFAHYGDRYFLKEIRCSAADMEETIPASKEEKRARTQEAKLAGGNEVLVALK
jgi:hypothetical protein